ncbi:hypothetical protein SAMN05660666_02476 [Novosphingobium aromaticivorans]|jgi:hypothetical protein|nr:hypothetical protein [Novosphingobium aromaticivorans]SCY68796.1 hypothetical protein SAMN05660666_02476 [Novosphingobium aromaticivorans]
MTKAEDIVKGMTEAQKRAVTVMEAYSDSDTPCRSPMALNTSSRFPVQQSRRPAMDKTERYALGIMVEEMGETLKLIGKAMRFGLDAPGPDNAEYEGKTAREMLPTEIGDLHAAIRFAAMAAIFPMSQANDRESWKLAKLLSPNSRDANGNRLAPDLTAHQPKESPHD